MMLGSRFDVGAELPNGLPEHLVAQITAVEESLSAEDKATKRWTLTWLENRPIVELDGGPRLEG